MTEAAAASSTPSVSVVIIFLNPGGFLAEAIGSVVAQSFADWELILVDDGSSDQSSAVARQAAAKCPRTRYLDHPGHANLGTSASRNLGLQAARGEYLLYLDADDVLFTDALGALYALAQSAPGVAAVFASVLWWFWAPEFAHQPDSVQSYGRWVGRFAPPRLLAAMVSNEDLHPANCSSLLRTGALREIGGFEPEFHGMYEDTVLLAKLLLGHTVLVSDRCVSAYRMHPASQCHRAAAEGSYDRAAPNAARGRYLRWLKRYIKARRIADQGLNWAVARELWAYDRPWLFRLVNSHKLRAVARYVQARLEGQLETSSNGAAAAPKAQAQAALAEALAAQGESAREAAVDDRDEPSADGEFRSDPHPAPDP